MWQKHKSFWLQKSFLTSVLLGLLFLIGSSFVNYYANFYTSSHASNYVTDLLLDNLPVIDVHLIFSEGAIVFILILIAILLYEPKYIPFVIKSIALFILTRSFFIVLTHTAPPQHEIFINPSDFISRISSGDDLFFSAHTGLPFLLAIIFWQRKYLRYFFLISTFIGASAVLLGHLHYSIDVFSALFIAFGIFHISKDLFKKDFQLIA